MEPKNKYIRRSLRGGKYKNWTGLDETAETKICVDEKLPRRKNAKTKNGIHEKIMNEKKYKRKYTQLLKTTANAAVVFNDICIENNLLPKFTKKNIPRQKIPRRKSARRTITGRKNAGRKSADEKMWDEKMPDEKLSWHADRVREVVSLFLINIYLVYIKLLLSYESWNRLCLQIFFYSN